MKHGVKFEIDENVAVLNMGENAFSALTDYQTVEKILNFYDSLKENDDIKVLLIINEECGYSEKSYQHFLFESEKDYRREEVINAIEINMVRRLILKLIQLDKIVIFGLSGDVLTTFFGMSLAANFRFATDETRFVVNHMKYKQHPSGALPFFLPLYVNQAIASDMMYKGGEIKSDKAIELGLINKIFDKSVFYEKCIDEAKEIAAIDSIVLKKTKKLSQYIIKELEDYFKIELKMIES
jgi:enoyl-CoA hydratase/carnithine racemase